MVGRIENCHRLRNIFSVFWLFARSFARSLIRLFVHSFGRSMFCVRSTSLIFGYYRIFLCHFVFVLLLSRWKTAFMSISCFLAFVVNKSRLVLHVAVVTVCLWIAKLSSKQSKWGRKREKKIYSSGADETFLFFFFFLRVFRFVLLLFDWKVIIHGSGFYEGSFLKRTNTIGIPFVMFFFRLYFSRARSFRQPMNAFHLLSNKWNEATKYQDIHEKAENFVSSCFQPINSNGKKSAVAWNMTCNHIVVACVCDANDNTPNTRSYRYLPVQYACEIKCECYWIEIQPNWYLFANIFNWKAYIINEAMVRRAERKEKRIRKKNRTHESFDALTTHKHIHSHLFHRQ